MRRIDDLLIGKHSRTKNSVLNFTTGIGGQILNVVLQFLVRTVFIQTLGKSYLGINGVFSNVLSMLSLAELGVGSAILYKLYEPISRNDYKRITALMHFYKTVYRYIGIVVAALGLLLIPFLPYLAKDYGKLASLKINAVFIFVLFLSRSVASYFFFAYKSGIIKANQKEYIINIVKYFGTIFASVLQVILLLLYHNFTLYVAVLIVTVICENVVIGMIADRMFPYINDIPQEKLKKSEIIGIFKDCGALLLYRLNRVVLKATDNLVLSSFFGFDMVALYSNYYIFYTTIDTILNRVFGSITHSLGNLHIEKNKEHEYNIFKTVNLITAILGGTAGIGIFVVSDELISAWIGEEWMIAQPFSALMGFEIYTLAVRHEFTRYRSSMGLFQQAKYRPLAGMIINLVLSVLLVRVWGICGVLVGTIAADWLTLVWYDPIITHKYGFKNCAKIKGYFLRFLKYTGTVILCGFAVNALCGVFFCGKGWLSVVVHVLICAVAVPCSIMLVSWKTWEGQYILTVGRREIARISKRLF